jgi:hypothetical protein
VAYWIRRWTDNPLGFPRVSTNLILFVVFFDCVSITFKTTKLINKREKKKKKKGDGLLIHWGFPA